MSALHWICALTLALVCCLSAQPVKRSTAGEEALLGAFPRFEKVIKTKCPEDTRLYSPTNIHEDCLSSALKCTIVELNVLEYECNVTKNYDFKIIKNGLRREKWNVTSSSTQNCICESYDQTDVHQFVKNMKSLVQQLYSRTLKVNLP